MEPGAMLRAARQAAGVSLADLARRTSYTKPYLSQLETGHRAVLPQHVAAYERALGGVVPLIEPVTWAAQHGTVTPEALTSVSASLATMRRHEDRTSGRAVLPTVRGLAAIADVYAREAALKLRPATLALASELHTYLGWLNIDAGRDDRARANFDAAVALAVEIDAADHLSHAVSFKGDLALRRGQFNQAVTLSQVSQRDKRTFLALRVYDGYQEAWAHALTGSASDAEHAMLTADGLLDHVPEATAPEGAYWYNVPFLLTQRATVHEALGRRDEAIRDLETGLAEMPDTHRNADWSRTIRDRLAGLRGE